LEGVVGGLEADVFVAVLVGRVAGEDGGDVEDDGGFFVGERVLGGWFVGEGVEPEGVVNFLACRPSNNVVCSSSPISSE